jgi:hypothetical protein
MFVGPSAQGVVVTEAVFRERDGYHGVEGAVFTGVGAGRRKSGAGQTSRRHGVRTNQQSIRMTQLGGGSAAPPVNADLSGESTIAPVLRSNTAHPSLSFEPLSQ